MADIFLSHSSADRDAAARVRSWLERDRAGWSVFLDIQPMGGIEAGQGWQDRLRNELQRSRVVLAVITADWLASRWCFAEAVTATFQGKDFFGVLPGDLSDDQLRVAPPVVHERQRQRLDLVTGAGWEQLLHALDQSGLDPNEWFSIPKEVGPYPGFVAFEERDAGVFFGRDSEITEYLDALNLLRSPDRAQALVISGGSGSGKSSLLKAGLMPRLRRQPNWLIVPPFDPSREPIHALFAALRITAGTIGAEIDLGDGSPQSVDDLHRRLQDTLRAIEEKVNGWLLLPLDQAEVLIAGSQGDGNTDASRLLAAIGRLLASRSRKLVAVLTIRTEFLPALERTLPGQVRLQNRSLRPIAALSEVIEKPAARFGIRLENGLTGRMVEETRGADALPLLAYTLRELYEKYGGDDLLTVAEYEQLGGVEGAIERKLTEALTDPSPTPEELAAFRRSFVRHLVRVDENAVEGERYLRTAARRDSLRREADRLIERLLNARLLIAGDDGTISIAHERLIRNWSNVPLQAWLAEDRHDRKLIDSLKSFLAAYKEGGPLLSQKPLADGRDFLEREPSLGNDEPELAQFIRASLAAQEARERRQRRLLIGAVAAAVVFLAVASGAIWSFLEARRRTAEAEFATLAADGARISTLAQLPEHSTEALESAIRLVAPIVRSGKSLPPQAVRGLTDAIAAVGFSVPEHHVLSGHKGKVESVAISPDGRRILTSGEDRTARLWDGGTLKLLQTYDRPDAYRMPGVASSSFSGDGRRAVLAGRNGAVMVDATNGDSLKQLDGGPGTLFAGFSSDGTRIITTGFGWIRLWDATTGDGLERFEDQGAVFFAALSPDNKTLAYGGQRLVLVVRNLESGERVEQHMDSWVHSGAFAPTGDQLLASSEYGSLLWDVRGAAIIRQGSAIHRVDTHTFSDRLISMGSEVLENQGRLDLVSKLPAPGGNSITFSALSRDGTRVVTLAANNDARVWNTSGKLLAILEGHTGSVLSAAFTLDGRRVVTASADGTARVWDLQPDLSLDSVTTGTSPIEVVAVSPDGQRIVGVSEDGGAVVWTPGRNGVVRLNGKVQRRSRPVFSADGRRVLAIGEDDIPRMLDAETGAMLKEYRGHDGRVYSADLSPDGTQVVTGGEDATVRLWDSASGAQRHRLTGHKARLGTVQFSPDGRRIVSSGAGVDDKDDPRALVWSVDGAPQMQLEGAVRQLEAGAFSRDGRMIVGEGEGGKATIWNAQSGKRLADFDTTRTLGLRGSFSADGGRLITTGDDGSAQLWDPQRSGSGPVMTFRADSGEADEARLSPDGSRLISHGRGQDLHLWNVTSTEPVVIFAGQSNGEGGVAFMPDGLRLVAASGRRLNVYPATVDQFLVRGCGMLRHRSAFERVEAVCPATTTGK